MSPQHLRDPFSPYMYFSGEEWGRLRADTPLTLDEQDLARLRGINERASLQEVEQIYLPLSRLLNLYVAGSQQLHRASSTFLGRMAPKVPYVIAIAGSVAVGKSTTARILQALLSRWPDHPKVDLVTTDGFLYPNRVLQERGLMQRKGFPESYDLRNLVGFLAQIKAGCRNVKAPAYSHLHYDVMDDHYVEIDLPDIVIVEGLNVLQSFRTADVEARQAVSDYFDFSIYVDADEDVIQNWFLERFRVLRQTAFQQPDSYFHRYASLSEDEAMEFAVQVWETINAVNLRQNILPTRERAKLILKKAEDHSIHGVALRKL